jgi:SAM-dependent methyltransferase
MTVVGENQKVYVDYSLPFEFVDFYDKFYGNKTGFTFLDIGSGKDGFLSKFIEEKRNRVVSVDIINELPCTDYILSIKADIFAISFVLNSFDCVIDNCCLQLFPFDEHAALVQRIRGWLKPNGRFYAKLAAECPYYKRVKSRLTHEDELERLFDGFVGSWSTSTVNLMTGETASHYIIDMTIAA